MTSQVSSNLEVAKSESNMVDENENHDNDDDDDALFPTHDYENFPQNYSTQEFHYDEVNEADIQRMAAALAPQMSELEDVLKDISTTDDDVSNALELAESANRTLMEEDDDMDGELQQLALSEQALRDELQFAHDMSVMLTPSKDEENPIPVAPVSPIYLFRDHPEPPPPPPPPPPRPATADTKVPSAYTLQDHADFLKLRTEKAGGWYYCDMSQYLPTSTETSTTDLVKDYCLPIPFRKLKRLYSGLMYHHVLSSSSSTTATPAKNAPTTPSTQDASQQPLAVTHSDSLSTLAPSLSTSSTPLPQEEPLPVRTVTIRIRPDVLCGAVMDAIHHAFEILPNNCTSHILKRQGGHLRGGVYIADKSLAYVADVQLCTQKNDELERRLVIRFYHIQDDPDAMNELGQALQQKVATSMEVATPGWSGESSSEDKSAANRHMKQSCSLIQRLMAAQQQGGSHKMDAKQQSSWLGLRDMAFDTKAEMQKAIGKHLESNFKTCPSVREENKKASPTIRRLTLPSLASKDWDLLEVSWTLTNSLVEELDTRDCTYNTISTLPFGQFPSLPTLDVHYCSQLRRLSREAMISNLLRAAKDLEDYAKGAEYNCAICIALLEPMLNHYGIPPLNFPKTSKPLREYPMEHTPPQVACPPWGSLVMEALNKIAAKTPTGDIDVVTAVKMVYNAFTRQDDEEQAARLGRKNAQIMERLAMLQAHQRSLVQNICDAHVYSAKASQSAATFRKRAQKATNAGKEGFPRVLDAEVPLLCFRVSLGASSSGTCYVTKNQMLFLTTYIPLVGGTKCMVFDLELVDFEVDESVPSTLLHPFPNTMKIVLKDSRRPIYQFRPSVSPTRLHKFLKIVQSFIGEEKPTEFSRVMVDSGNVSEMMGEMRLTETQDDDDHLSI